VHVQFCAYAGIFGAAYIRCATMEKAVNGFRTTGISPFNPDVYSDDDFAPSLATEQPLCAPIEPSSVPVEPSSAPVEPSSAPTDPSSALTEPSSAPTKPSSHRVTVTDISPLPKVNHVGPRKRSTEGGDAHLLAV